MSKLLMVEASPRDELSISREIARRFRKAWLGAHPHDVITERDLTKTNLPFVTAPWINAIRTPLEKQTIETKETLAWSDFLVDELLAADTLAISTPVYNYNVPGNLKVYIDHVVRRGRTLGSAGEGLLQGKRAVVLIASGAIYKPGSAMESRDLTSAYLRLIFNVIGIHDVTVVAGGGTKSVELGDVSRENFLEALQPEIEAAAIA